MNLNDLEHHAFAFYVAGPANDLSIATRFYPYGELVMIITDKIDVAVRPFGGKAQRASKAAATAFVDGMIAAGGWSTTQNKFGGSMHQWQGDAFRAELRRLQAEDPVIAKSREQGDGYWAEAFAALIAA